MSTPIQPKLAKAERAVSEAIRKEYAAWLACAEAEGKVRAAEKAAEIAQVAHRDAKRALNDATNVLYDAATGVTKLSARPQGE
jgi:hypothetical protein